MRDPDLMAPGAFRTLTAAERAIAEGVFGPALDTRRIRIFALPVWSRAFAAGGRLIVWPARTARKDFAQAPLFDLSVFVHELTHAWQAQNGVNLILGKLKAGDRAQSYAYDLSDNRDFRMLNIEQQAMVVQHAFVASRGGSAPYESHAYSAILATWQVTTDENPREV
ncbi:MAG TPA: hypothetical protein VFW47_17945 [Phenylobacterium sp.]|nr:hypothetical protein [Phenylobacterium sp.]